MLEMHCTLTPAHRGPHHCCCLASTLLVSAVTRLPPPARLSQFLCCPMSCRPCRMQSLAPPPGLDEAQLLTWRQEGGFLQQLLDNSAAEDYQLPIAINGTLRRYQQVHGWGCLWCGWPWQDPFPSITFQSSTSIFQVVAAFCMSCGTHSTTAPFPASRQLLCCCTQTGVAPTPAALRRRASTGWPSCAGLVCTACWRTTWGWARRCSQQPSLPPPPTSSARSSRKLVGGWGGVHAREGQAGPSRQLHSVIHHGGDGAPK
jgi:hypothetical protein